MIEDVTFAVMQGGPTSGLPVFVITLDDRLPEPGTAGDEWTRAVTAMNNYDCGPHRNVLIAMHKHDIGPMPPMFLKDHSYKVLVRCDGSFLPTGRSHIDYLVVHLTTTPEWMQFQAHEVHTWTDDPRLVPRAPNASCIYIVHSSSPRLALIDEIRQWRWAGTNPPIKQLERVWNPS